MILNDSKYIIHECGNGDWIVFDQKLKTEICICNAHEDETQSAKNRAELISLALNTNECIKSS